MKLFYTLSFIAFLSTPASAQMYMGGNYSLGIPQQEMAENIQPSHGLNVNFLYRLPDKLNRLSVGLETGLGFYAYETKQQDLRFPDGSGTTTDVTYSSNIFNIGVQSRANLFSQAKWNPYIMGKAGFTKFFSNITIGDPDDPDDCKPLDKRNLIGDNTMYVAYGGGLNIDFAAFSKKMKMGLGMVDISVTNVRGGKLDYINTKNIKEHVHVDPNAPPPPPTKAEPVNVRFINVSTQQVHEHQVAEVYNSPLRMLTVQVGVLLNLEW